MAATMRAQRFYKATREWAVEDVPIPEPGPGEVLVRTLACGICGSDLHALKHADKFVETSRRVRTDLELLCCPGRGRFTSRTDCRVIACFDEAWFGRIDSRAVGQSAFLRAVEFLTDQLPIPVRGSYPVWRCRRFPVGLSSPDAWQSQPRSPSRHRTTAIVL